MAIVGTGLTRRDFLTTSVAEWCRFPARMCDLYTATEDKSQVLAGEQSNSSMLFENKFFLKLYRKLEDGVNPDVEVTRFLTERGFPHVPSFRGAIEYRRGKAEPTVVCLLQSAVASERDGWALTLDSVGRYYE